MYLTGPGGVMVERSLGVRKVAGSIPSRDIPKVVKRWYMCSLAYARHWKVSAWKYGWSAQCQLIMWLGGVILSNTCDRIVPVWQHYNLTPGRPAIFPSTHLSMPSVSKGATCTIFLRLLVCRGWGSHPQPSVPQANALPLNNLGQLFSDCIYHCYQMVKVNVAFGGRSPSILKTVQILKKVTEWESLWVTLLTPSNLCLIWIWSTVHFI